MTWQVYHVGLLASDRSPEQGFVRDSKSKKLRYAGHYVGTVNGGPRRKLTSTELMKARGLDALASSLERKRQAGEILLAQRRHNGACEYLWKEREVDETGNS